MSNKYLEKIASSDISRDALFKGVKHLNTDYYDGQHAGAGDSARAAGWSALYGAGLGGGATAAMGSVIPLSHVLRGNNTLAKLSLGGVGRKSLIGAGIGAAGLGAMSLLRRYGSMKRTEDFYSKANALGISPEDRKHYVEEYNAFDGDLPVSETAQRVHALMHNKQASDTEYRGLSGWQTAGLTAAGLGGSSAMLGSALNDVITPEIQNHLVGGDTRPLILRMRELIDSAKNGMEGVKSNPLAYKIARKGAGAVALGGLALSLPVGVAAHRQYQDFQSGNQESHYLRSALLGGVAGGLAPTKHLTVGRGALAGAVSNVIAGRVVNSLMNKKASDTEYRGLSGWQTAGIVGAGVLGSAALGARAVHVLDKTLKPHGLGRVNLDELRNIHWRDAESLHPDVQSALKSLERSTAIAGVPAAVGIASVPAVALHRQYQDYKSGNKDPHYGRGALLGTIAGTTALNTLLGLGGGAALGLGAVGLNHLHNKWSNHE